MSRPDTPLARLPLLVALVLAPLVPIPATAAEDEPVAIVSLLVGPASEVVAEGAPPRDLRLFDRVRRGATLRTGSGGRLTVAFFSGERFEIAPDSSARVEERSLAKLSGQLKPLPPVPVVPRVAPIATSEKASGRAGAIRIRGGSRVTAPRLDPGDGAIVLSEAATLRFSDVEGADRYRVEVENEAGELVLELETRSREVTVPPGILVAGQSYFWRSRAVLPTGVGPWGEAFFTTVRSDDAASRRALAEKARETGDLATLLLLAEVDRGLGLTRESCRSFEVALEKAGDAAPAVREAASAAGCR